MKQGKRVPLEQRFWERVDRRGPDECWPWMGAPDKKGYGRLGRGGRSGGDIFAHRLAWAIAHGPIPDGMCVCHHCDNPRCCNAEAHLFLGTIADNNLDMRQKGRASGGSRAGTRNHKAKLTEEKVRLVRQDWDDLRPYGLTVASMARAWGLDWSTMDALLQRKTWRHV